MKKWAAACIALMVSACGFHLKGSAPYDKLPESTWQVSGSDIQSQLETALRRAGGTVGSDTPAKIVVSRVSTNKEVSMITRAGLASEFSLLLEVNAQAYYRGEPWGKPMAVTVQRNLEHATGNTLGQDAEEGSMWQDMRREAAAQIVRRLAFLQKVD